MIDYLRDGREKLSGQCEFERCVKDFVTTLNDGWGSVVGKMWYLHLLNGHLSGQLKRFGGSIYFASCSAQERLNGKHTHHLLSCVQTHRSSHQLFVKEIREIHFDLHPEEKQQTKTHTKKRKRKTEEERLREIGINTTKTLNEQTQKERPKKKKKKDRRTKVFLEEG